MCEAIHQDLLLVPRKPCDKVGAFAEHIEQVEDSQDDGHITGRQQRSQMLHAVIQMPSEAVLNQQ